MKRRHHSPEQIIRKLRVAERSLGEGKQIPDSEATFHRWRNQYGGLKAADASAGPTSLPTRSPLRARCPGVAENGHGPRTPACDELLDVDEFSCLAEARVVIGDWQEDYIWRPHSMLTPAACAARWSAAGEQAAVAA